MSLTPEQAKMLDRIHRAYSTQFNYANHHMNPEDDIYGHVMAIRKDLDTIAHRADVGLVQETLLEGLAKLSEESADAAIFRMAEAMERLADAIIGAKPPTEK